MRPSEYQEINNFYTSTVYEKGAEVVRMMQTLTADASATNPKAGFNAGMKLYFERHDGQAVTCDDFAQAISDANPASALAKNLDPFKRWYSQGKTPKVTVAAAYDAAAQSYTLTLTQSCEPSKDVQVKEPFVIPFAVQLGLYVSPVGFSSTGPSGLATTVPGPLRSTTAPDRSASASPEGNSSTLCGK